MMMKAPDPGQHPTNNLDFLRLFFAALVIVAHSPEVIDGTRERELLSRLTSQVMSLGEVGLNGFFALSGYLIVASWVRRPQWNPYFRNRVLRIYPGFVIAFCISVLIVGPLGSNPSSYFAQFDLKTFLVSLLLLQNPIFVKSFDGQPWPYVNGAMWSISYEFCCYIAVAIVGIMAANRLRLVWVVVTGILLVLTCRLPELRRLPPVGPFAVGQCIRLATIFFTGGSLFLLGFRGIRRLSLIAVLGLLFGASLFSYRYNAFGFALFGTPFLLSIGLLHQKLSLLRDMPDISYGTYLYGWPIQKLMHWYWPGLDIWGLTVASLILALICGYLSWNWVEARFMKLKVRRSNPYPINAHDA